MSRKDPSWRFLEPLRYRNTPSRLASGHQSVSQSQGRLLNKVRPRFGSSSSNGVPKKVGRVLQNLGSSFTIFKPKRGGYALSNNQKMHLVGRSVWPKQSNQACCKLGIYRHRTEPTNRRRGSQLHEAASIPKSLAFLPWCDISWLTSPHFCRSASSSALSVYRYRDTAPLDWKTRQHGASELPRHTCQPTILLRRPSTRIHSQRDMSEQGIQRARPLKHILIPRPEATT